LFSASLAVPRFSRVARSYLLQIGQLDWQQINPDIFGSMIQAVADDDERSALGLHYTSVPNILKVLKPLFLDDLQAKLVEAGANKRLLLNLRKRIAGIRVFDPACGSGNFLVIAYKELRALEAEINQRRGEVGLRSEIPLTNFRGIEIRPFAAEVARLALIIAEYQCDVRYRGQQLALADFLPLEAMNWITCGNALRLDWLSICPPTGTGVKVQGDDLFAAPLDQAAIDFENAGGEIVICGNPPYKGSQTQTKEQKSDLESVFAGKTTHWKSLDYVSGWFLKAAEYSEKTQSCSAFVSTNSICQGRQVDTLWPLIYKTGNKIIFAHTNFRWANLASHNAGVTVVIVGLSRDHKKNRRLFSIDENQQTIVKETNNINAYLADAPDVIVRKSTKPISQLPEMSFGNMPNEGGHLLLSMSEAEQCIKEYGVDETFIRPFLGSEEFIRGKERRCIWVREEDFNKASLNEWLSNRFDLVRQHRERSSRATTRLLAKTPHRFGEVRQTGNETMLVIPRVSSESRPFLPVGLLPKGTIISDSAFALYDAPIWNMALIASRLHLVWIATICGKLETRYRYSNTLGWNTFPVPFLTQQNKDDLSQSAENILFTREHYFPATIADLYDSETMPDDLRAAHDYNDELIERIYSGRRFKNDTDRLEKLFALYTTMTNQ
jgi:hypothetical protein